MSARAPDTACASGLHLGAAGIIVVAMSSDRKGRGPVRRPRAIERPQLPPGPLADLKALVYELYLEAGTPTLDEIAVRVAGDDGLAGAPGRDTIGRVIRDPAVPASQADVVAVVTVLARAARWDPGDAAGRARDLWVAARMASARYPAAGVRVGEADPRRLGVHAAISVAGVLDEVPPEYVPRDVDAAQHGMRVRVAAAARRGGFVLLVGGSSVGKTRCAFEAVRALLPDWWLVHPAGPGEVAALAATPAPRMVVWLDELQRYLDGEHGLVGGVIRMLLNAPDPVVIVGTMWPELYTAYTTVPGHDGADPYARERQVLDLADVVRIAPEFSAAEQARARAAAAQDPRVRVALEAAGYGLTQTLAAAPQLVAHWQNAKTADPYAWAVLTAALDAARLGARAPLSADLLRDAAPGYCTSQQQAEAPDNWFEQAMAYVTGKLHGAAAALSPAGAGMGQVAGYTAADYLIQHASRERRDACVPASTWDAILSHLSDPADTTRLADSAKNRLLYCCAVPLYRNAAEAGDKYAARRLADLLHERGDLDGLRARADAGDESAAWRLASLLAKSGDLDGAVQMLRAPADAGDEVAAYRLADLLAERGDMDGAVQVLRARADAGDEGAAWRLASLLHELSPVLRARRRLRPGRAVQVLRARADAGHEVAALKLADLLAERGDLKGLRARADAGDKYAARRLADLLRERGDLDGAVQVLRARADAGDGIAIQELAGLLAERGDLEGLRARADAGDEVAALKLADLLIERGDLDGAVQVLRARADAGDEYAARRLADLLIERGDLDGAVQVLRAGADAGDEYAAQDLAGLLAERGDLEGLRARADAGDGRAAVRLADLLAERGDLEGLRARAATGDEYPARRLADLLRERGDLEGLRARAATGDEHAARLLPRLLTRQGRGEEAERLRRFGLNPDGSIASGPARRLARPARRRRLVFRRGAGRAAD